MSHKALDVVVLERDLPDNGLRKGDLGAIVEVLDSDHLEVEFVTAAGRTQALVTLSPTDVRSIVESDLVAVRSLRRSA